MSVQGLPWIASSVEWHWIQEVLKWTSSLKTMQWCRVSSLSRELDHVQQVARCLSRIEDGPWLIYLFKDHVEPAMHQLLRETESGTEYNRMKRKVYKHFVSWVIKAALEPGKRQSNKAYMERVFRWKDLHSFQPKKIRILENRLDRNYYF